MARMDRRLDSLHSFWIRHKRTTDVGQIARYSRAFKGQEQGIKGGRWGSIVCARRMSDVYADESLRDAFNATNSLGKRYEAFRDAAQHQDSIRAEEVFAMPRTFSDE